MPIDKGKLLSQLKSHSNPLDISKNDQFVSSQIHYTYKDSERLLNNQVIQESMKYILWNDLWNSTGTFGRNKDNLIGKATQNKYSCGQKVFVNFGYNIGREASMPHPAIIVKNFKHLAIVVPTTSDDGANLGELEKLTIHCPNDNGKGIFPSDDIVEIHQIRCIGKNRIIRDLGVNVKDYILPNSQVDVLNQTISDRLTSIGYTKDFLSIPYNTDLRTIIDIMLSFHYSPELFKTILETQRDLRNLEIQVQSLESELAMIKSQKEAATGSEV